VSFQPVAEDNVLVSNNELRRVNFALQIAKTQEVVEVSAEQIALADRQGRRGTRESPARKYRYS